MGYGDISLDNDDSRLFASFQILVSVSWLAKLIGDVGDLITQRAHDIQAVDAVNNQLSEKMIENMDFSKDGQVDKAEYIVGMLITMGAQICGENITYEDHVKPHLDRFDKLNCTNGETLGIEDLEFMIEQGNKQQLLNRKADKLLKSKQTVSRGS